MAKVTLSLEADNAFELQELLRGFSAGGGAFIAHEYEPVRSEAERPDVGATEDVEPAKRTRRTKAQIAEDEAAAAERAKAALDKADPARASDPFSDQVKESAREEAAGAKAISIDDMRKAMVAFQDKGTPKQMQEIFKKYDGAERLSELKPGHYAACHAELTA